MDNNAIPIGKSLSGGIAASMKPLSEAGGRDQTQQNTTEYTRIVQAYMDTVYRIAINYAKSVHDAEDVVQNTFVKLLTRKVDFRDEEHIRRWLIRVAVNECNNLCSSYWRRNVDSMDAIGAGMEFTAQEPESGAASEYSSLYDAVRMLPPKCRIVVHLFYYEGYSSKEIADILHIREATVRTRLVRARKLLKEQLKEAWEYEE